MLRVLFLVLGTYISLRWAAAEYTTIECLFDYMCYLKHHKKDLSRIHDEKRAQQFHDSCVFVFNHNRRAEVKFELGLSDFADMLQHERDALFPVLDLNVSSASPLPLYGSSIASLFRTQHHLWPSAAPPTLDWSTKNNPTGRNILPPVHNQGSCGACWAFVSAGSAEAAVSISTSRNVQLSVQQLVDCDSTYNRGCFGGNPVMAYEYIMHNGLMLEEAYPYASEELSSATHCAYDRNLIAASIESYSLVQSCNEEALRQFVAVGPVSTGICGTDQRFMFYESGVFDADDCCQTLNHAVLIVGYGVAYPDGDSASEGIPFWLVRNSWSEHWGEGGYMRIRRNEKGGSRGVCGLAVAPSVAVDGYTISHKGDSENDDDGGLDTIGGDAHHIRHRSWTQRLQEWLQIHWQDALFSVSLVLLLVSVSLCCYGCYLDAKNIRNSASDRNCYFSVASHRPHEERRALVDSMSQHICTTSYGAVA